jgi:catechol 2,3-dioxygenase-like lactoylglutathione lyase family enzyme
VKLNSISGVSCFVKDLDTTAEFYESLGFRVGNRDPDRLTCYVNWFWITFIAQDGEVDADRRKDAKASNRGAGQYLYIKVDDLDGCCEEIVGRGLKPDGEPRKMPSGNREFVLRDPDGYKLAFFAKK